VVAASLLVPTAPPLASNVEPSAPSCCSTPAPYEVASSRDTSRRATSKHSTRCFYRFLPYITRGAHSPLSWQPPAALHLSLVARLPPVFFAACPTACRTLPVLPLLPPPEREAAPQLQQASHSHFPVARRAPAATTSTATASPHSVSREHRHVQRGRQAPTTTHFSRRLHVGCISPSIRRQPPRPLGLGDLTLARIASAPRAHTTRTPHRDLLASLSRTLQRGRARRAGQRRAQLQERGSRRCASAAAAALGHHLTQA
jgi:hypothetical protein